MNVYIFPIFFFSFYVPVTPEQIKETTTVGRPIPLSYTRRISLCPADSIVAHTAKATQTQLMMTPYTRIVVQLTFVVRMSEV